MKKIIVITKVMILATVFQVKAQSQTSAKDSTIRTMPFQASLFYPIGSNGIDAYKIKNVVSFNALVGVSAGVEFFEFAGFGNLTNGDVNGGQFAGFFNANKGNVRGFQGSGFLNIVHGEFQGAQFGGFANVNSGKFNGAQMAGFCNVNTNNLNGAQLSGFANTAVGNLNGVQASGFANVVTDTIIGSQLSGFVNYAKHVKGFQIGVFNISDTISGGLPIGFFSYSKTGYHKIEIEAGNQLYANASFKTGVKKFYNIFTVGAGTSSNEFVWGVGYGAGTLFSLSDALDMNIDLTATQLLKDGVDEDKINILNKLKVNVAYKISDNISVYGGPSLDVLVHDDALESEVKNSFKKWHSNDITTKATIGFNAGIRF